MMTVLERMAAHKIVAIVRLDDLSTAQYISAALIEGGIRIIEFTLTSPDAATTIARMRQFADDAAVIGAGSVITAEEVRAVADAGAQFVVSPVSKAEVIHACAARDLPAMPGAFTPTEIQQAWEWGASAVKVFPANHLRRGYIKDLLAPLPHLRLMPTGGVTVDNIRGFFDDGAFAVGVGSALVNNQAVADGDWDKLRRHAQQFADRLAANEGT